MTNYESKDILVLEGLDAVRLRPGMYIGTTGINGFHHLLWEIVDNAMDEATNGFGDTITVTLHKDGSASVRDNGRGIPVDIHPTLKVSGVEVVYTQLHAGGKFNNSNYSFSGGLHGVGASVTNALSEWLKVTVNRNGKQYYMEFASIADSKGKIHSGKPVTRLKEIGASNSTGTYVEFLPDKRVFGNIKFDNATIANRLRDIAFLNRGIKLNLVDERQDQNSELRNQTFYYEGGLNDFVKYIIQNKKPLFDKPLYIEGKTDIVEVQLSCIYTDDYTANIFSFVNNIPTTEGGTHETGMKSAFTRLLNEYARSNGYLKDKDANFLGEDFTKGLVAVLSIKLKTVQFEGQTKAKLGNPEAKPEVESVVYSELNKLSMRSDLQKVFDAIMKKAIESQKEREAIKRAKDLARSKNSIDISNLTGKLKVCTGNKAELNELFIVEGDSAGGSASSARDRRTQAILPLRGKPLNAEKKRLEQVLANEEIRSLISALNTGILDDFSLSTLKYHKVIILSDADQDGAHIRAILLTFFYRYMRELITNGHVYIGMPPLYLVYKKGVKKYVYSDKELDEAIAEVGKGYQIQRYKGLGEMDPEQLWETTMDPKKRVLMKVNIDDVVEAEKMITTLMGDSIDARKEYILTNCDFNKQDRFEKIGG